MRPPLHVFDRLVEIALLFDEDLKRSFAGTALTTSRVHLMWELDRLGPSTHRALASALQVSARNITGLVDALETAGYVVRRPHPSDRRAILVTLTEQGAQTVEAMARDRSRTAAELVAGIGAGRLDQLARDLDLITERLHTLVEDSRPLRRSSA